jgi:hypothetical protein
MLPNYEIQIVPSGMTIYNPPMSDDAFNPAIGNISDYNKAAKEICIGEGKLAQNKRDYTAYALQLAKQRDNVSGWNEVINGLEGAKKTDGCEWGAKRGRVAEVIRVLKREKSEWEKAKAGIGTPVVDRVDGKTQLTAPNWNPTTANWEAIAKDLGDKLLSKQELVSILKSKISIELAKGNNDGIILAQKIYDGSINGLEINKKAVAWGVKRTRVNAAIRLIKSTIRRPETLVDIVSGQPVKIDTPSLEDLAKETSETEKNFFDKIGDFFGISPDDEAGDVTGGDINGSGEDDKPNYTPLLAGGGVVVAIILVGVLVSAANKGVKPKS